MRTALLAKAPLRLQISKNLSQPPPVGGWNARDAYSAMDAKDAITLQNWFPGTSAVFTRGGSSSHATGMTGNGKTLAIHSSLGGTESMFCATSSNIYDVTSAGAVGAGKLSRSNGKHQWVNYGDGTNNWLIMVNGVDKPAYFDGTTWTAVDGGTTPAITGITTTDIIGVMVYQGRVMFIQKNTLKFWYLPSGVVGGAATAFDLSTEASKGGYLMAMMNWTYDSGDGSDDRAVFVTSMGEVIVYQGNNPASAAAWGKIGTYYVGRPLGRRCLCKYGGDLLVLTQDGIVSMASALTGVPNQSKFKLSDKISTAFSDAALSYGANFGWEIFSYPQEDAIMVNIPVLEDAEHKQYVMNAITKSWCSFTQWNAETFGILNKQLYYASATTVIKAWTGTTDVGNPITGCIAQTAFNRLQSSSPKKVKFIRSTINAGGAGTSYTEIMSDFAEPLVSGGSTTTMKSGLNDDWKSPPSYSGIFFSVYLSSSPSYQLQWLSQDWMWEDGAGL